MDKLIEIICDGSGDYGFGHIRRSTSLMKALEEAGFATNLIVLSSIADTDLSSNELPAVRIIDLPYEIDELVSEAKKIGSRCIALDYFGDANPHLTISIFEHLKNVPRGNRVSGFKYAIIRPEIARAESHNTLENVLIMIGGSDIRSCGAIIAQKVSLFCDIVYLIQGPMSSSSYKISQPSVHVLKDPANLQNIMASSKWGVTNGGGSMMEMMSLGKAVYVIPQTTEEDNLARYLLEMDGILGIGLDSINSPSEQRINRVGQQARSIVDGLGLKRIMGHVNHQLSICALST